MPKPRANPLTSWVLPAPKSPVRPITHPAAADLPQVSPSICVASGLFEMNVTMSGEWAGASFVTYFQPRLRNNLSNTGQFESRKFVLPTVKHTHGIFAGNGKQEFKILAIGQGGEQRRFAGRFGFGLQTRGAADGDGTGQDFCSQLGGAQQMAQIAGQAVADIDHRMDVKVFGQPASFNQARLDLQMLACQRAAQFA